MTKVASHILVLFLTICLRAEATQIYSTLNAGSTAGNFYGSLYLSFSAAGGAGALPASGVNWGSSSSQPSYTVPGASLALALSVLSENPNNLTFLSSFTFADSRIGIPSFNFSLWPGFSSGYFVPGQPSVQTLAFDSGNAALFDYSQIGPPIGTIDFNYVLPVIFDGTTGTGIGSWSLTYTVAGTSNVPDGGSSVFMLGISLLLLGGFYFGISRRNQIQAFQSTKR